MHYSEKLKADKAALQARLDAVEGEINRLILFFHSPKFVGEDNGERKDWVSTGDAISYLQNLRSVLHTEV